MTTFVAAAASHITRDQGALLDRAANLLGTLVLLPGLLIGAGMFVVQSL